MFSLLPLMVLYFPCCVRVSLDYKLEFFQVIMENILMNFQSIMSQKTKCNLFLRTNIIFFDVITILMHHFVLFFGIFSQKEKQYLVKLHDFFFAFYVGWKYILRDSLFIKVLLQWRYSTHNLLEHYPIFNLTYFFQCYKKLQKQMICPSEICLSDIITSSRITLIFFPYKMFSLKRRLKFTEAFT